MSASRKGRPAAPPPAPPPSAEAAQAQMETLWATFSRGGSFAPGAAPGGLAVPIETCAAFVEARLSVHKKPEAAARACGLDAVHELPALRAFVALTETAGFVRSCIGDAVAGRMPELPGPLDGRPQRLLDSFGAMGCNFVRFGSGDASFLLMQSVSCIDAVLVPARGLFLRFDHAGMQQVAGALADLCADPGLLVRERPVERLAALLARHPRPFHFFYEVAPGVELVADLLAGWQGELAHYGPEQRFASLAGIYGLPAQERLLPITRLNALHLRQGSYAFHLGVRNNPRNAPLREAFDERMRAWSAEAVPPEFHARVQEQFPAGATVLWFGITGQKRSWVEQVEGIAAIATRLLAERGPDLVFILDGWTASHDPSAAARAGVAEDEEVVRAIVARLPSGARWFSTVGLRSCEKLVVAARVDCFLANHASGSLHVSRMARRPGVSHLSKALPAAGHTHHAVERIPAAAITDIAPEDAVRNDFVSYSFDWRLAYDAMVRVLDRSAARPAQ